MLTRFALILASCLLGMAFFAPKALAEGNCPPGYFPIGGGSSGWQGCAPMGPDSGSGGNQSVQPVLKPRWGAIAITNGAFGVAADADSKAQAESQALSDCQAMSKGKACVVRMAYENQCLALAWGARGNAVSHAPRQDEAEELAMAHCTGKGAACEIY
jgi:hypothetical protein